MIRAISVKPYNKNHNRAVNSMSSVSFEAKSAKEVQYKKITKLGYKPYSKVRLYDAGRNPVQGHSFIKRSSGQVEVLITDDQYNDIGIASASKAEEGWLLIVQNFASPRTNYYIRSESPINHYSKSNPSPKKYTRVGTAAYNVLEKEVPRGTKLVAYITSSGSWEFHKKRGYKCPWGDEYDSYAGSPQENVMYKTVK